MTTYSEEIVGRKRREGEKKKREEISKNIARSMKHDIQNPSSS
jgi:hypothetical protein